MKNGFEKEVKEDSSDTGTFRKTGDTEIFDYDRSRLHQS